jgi:hypothetical protein
MTSAEALWTMPPPVVVPDGVVNPCATESVSGRSNIAVIRRRQGVRPAFSALQPFNLWVGLWLSPASVDREVVVVPCARKGD